jgi:regulatory protein spx
MPLSRAQFISYGKDAQCLETQRFIEEAGIVLDIRDIEKEPLTEEEVAGIVAYFDLRHFLNPFSKTYEKRGLDRTLPKREEIFKMIAEDHTLLRRPIIRTARLVTVGFDKKAISNMLQISANGQRPADNEKRINIKPRASVSSGK